MNILLISTIGIYFSYILMSLIDEQIIQILEKSNEDPNHYFNVQACLSLLFCFIFATIHEKVKGSKRTNKIPRKQKVWMGFLFATALITSYSVKGKVPYLILIVTRQSRILFIIILGVLFSRVKSSTSLKLTKQKIITGIIITVGVIIFSYFRENQKAIKNHAISQQELQQSQTLDVTYVSYFLIIASLVSQALLSDSQAYEKKQFSATANHLMKSTSKYAFLFTLTFTVSACVWQNGSLKMLQQFQLQGLFICHALLQIFGQFSIYNVVVNYKQHVFPMISVTRKIFTLIISSLFVGNSIQNRQYIGVFIILLGIIYEIYDERRYNKASKTGKMKKFERLNSQQNQKESDINIETQKGPQFKEKKLQQKID